MVKQPFGEGTKEYNSVEAIEMIHDMEPYSQFEDLFDALNILSEDPNPGHIIRGQILNLVVPQGFQGDIYNVIGDHFTYCITSATPKRLGDIKYKAQSCQVKFKMRAVASFNKIPGCPKFSGYKQINMVGPGMLATHGQMAHIIERMTDEFPEFRDTRSEFLSRNPPAEKGLAKEALFVKMVEGATRSDRLLVANTILAVLEDTRFLVFDMVNYAEDQKERLTLL